MRKPKIVVIGAGSASFGLSVLGSLLREPGLRGSTLGLVDLNAEGLRQVAALAERLTAMGRGVHRPKLHGPARPAAGRGFRRAVHRRGPREVLAVGL